MIPKNAETRWSQKEWYGKPTKLQFQLMFETEKFDALKTLRLTEVDRRTWLNVPSGTFCPPAVTLAT